MAETFRYILKETVRGSPRDDICGVFDSLDGAWNALREETDDVIKSDPDLYNDEAWIFAENKDNVMTCAYLLPKSAIIPQKLVKGSSAYHMALEDQSSMWFCIVKCPTNKRGRFYS